ncbi:uncharacterized protein BDZ99DRAFT_419922 [Mytilinidion resinicola]|uniref:Capsule polysaccharide biosynthesis protein n=1 Tax=Mytilinidion resinicola TaxID=574789 RepID=A0A6A6YFG0_9PEZI|nr:uncharacterized protein BDZ99DRAFT_419922 [Mytilinidion resinicola]KAF2807566.1 hypothetical protein BDZ99DRAFT_419922 [Mytilinidion resinicola]
MQRSNFAIPEEFASKLRFVDALDKRSDEEILDSLAKHTPITSEKNVWTYWHSGLRSMPPWCQRNIINWVRLLGPSWTVRVLDTVPSSPNHALTWLDSDMLPESFVKGTMQGPYTGPHSADFQRGAALYKYGGVWMDVGIVLIRHLDKICWDQLADPSSPFEVSVPWMYGQVMANHFVASRKGDPFIKRWHDLFIHFWKGQNDHSGIVQSPLIGFVKDVRFEDSVARGFKWDFKVDELTVMGYIGQCVAWLRLCMLEEPNGGFNGVEYWANKILLFDSLTEDWAAEQQLGFTGQAIFDALVTKRDADPKSEEYQKAYKAIWRLLTKSSMQKITHGKHLTETPALGIFLDAKENQGADIASGTFAELLRFGSVHLEQTRESIDYIKAERPDPEKIMKKGLLEP